MASAFSVERPVARYTSAWKIEGRKLTIVRELEIKQESVNASDKPELESLGNMIREDQQRPLTLRRIGHLDTKTRMPRVSATQLADYGLRAFQQKDHDATRQLLEQAVRARPDDGGSWNNLGRTYAALGKLEQARNAYERLIALSPKDHAVFNNLALLFERQGYWERAVESFRKQIEVHPGDANATVNLPRALMHLGRWAEAEQAAVAAARAQPANAPQRATVTVARVCQDKIADPRQELDVALGSSPSTSTLTPAF